MLGLAVLAAACASAPRAGAPPAVQEHAQAARSYSARLHVSLRGPGLRARTVALVAFRRPDEMRIEVPGPTGARLLAVTRGGRLSAVFPGQRAYLEEPASARSLEALLGIALTPEQVMDMLLGIPSSGLRRFEVRWGASYPRQVEATLADGTRLKAKVEDADLEVDLPAQAFAPLAHPGFRQVAMDEARDLWTR